MNFDNNNFGKEVGSMNFDNMDFGNMDFGNMDFGNMDFDNMNFGNMNFDNMNFGNINFGNMDIGNIGSQKYYLVAMDNSSKDLLIVVDCLLFGMMAMIAELWVEK